MVYGFVGLTVVALFILFMVLYARKKNLAKEEEVRAFAEVNGLDYRHEKRLMYVKPHLSGEKDGIPFVIYEEVQGTGKSKRAFTVLQYNDVPFDFQFSICKENFMSKLGKVFGIRDIEFQNASFDKTFLLKSEDESQFRALMDYKLQDALMKNSAAFDGILENKAGVLSYTISGEMNKPGVFEKLIVINDFLVQTLKSKIE